MFLPADDFILLSLINTYLRDKYDSLESLCEEEGIEISELVSRLASIGYAYSADKNAFVQVD